jgi:hypothetical protein
MALKDKVIQVPEAVDVAGEKLANFLKAVDKAIEDGWQAGQDLPVLLSAAVVDLVPAIASMKGAAEDLKAHPYASGKALVIHVADALEAFLTKPAAPSA